MSTYSESGFVAAITNHRMRIVVAELMGHLVGFAQITLGAAHELAPPGSQSELLRLYVQERFTGQQIGTRLLKASEQLAADNGSSVIWLTPWVHNVRARNFYARCGYQDFGLTHFTFEGESHENRLYARRLS